MHWHLSVCVWLHAFVGSKVVNGRLCVFISVFLCCACTQEDSSMCDCCPMLQLHAYNCLVGMCQRRYVQVCCDCVCLSVRMQVCVAHPENIYLLHHHTHPVPAETGYFWDWTSRTVGSHCPICQGVTVLSSGAAQWQNWTTPWTSPGWATSARQYSDWCYYNRCLWLSTLIVHY